MRIEKIYDQEYPNDEFNMKDEFCTFVRAVFNERKAMQTERPVYSLVGTTKYHADIKYIKELEAFADYQSLILKIIPNELLEQRQKALEVEMTSEKMTNIEKAKLIKDNYNNGQYQFLTSFQITEDEVLNMMVAYGELVNVDSSLNRPLVLLKTK